MPIFCQLISANGTDRRMDVINEFVKDHPVTSACQATQRFTEFTTKDRPSCVNPLPGKKSGKGRTVMFYLRPQMYHMLLEEERPDGWEVAAEADEVLYDEEHEAKAKTRAERDQKMSALMSEKGAESDDGTQNSASGSMALTSLTGDNEEEEYVDEDNDSGDDVKSSERHTKKRKA